MKMNWLLWMTASAALAAFAAGGHPAKANSPGDWRKTIVERVPLYGHRNWIAIVNSAYPAQTSPGVETIVTDADQTEAVKTVLKALAGSKHVRPIVYTDAELNYVDEADAPGVTDYRNALKQILGSQQVSSIPHEQIIHKLDEAGQTFRVLIIKTNMTIPYTSVFLQLDCKYWSAAAEQRLRAKMPAETPDAGK